MTNTFNLQYYQNKLPQPPFQLSGILTDIKGLTVEATGLKLPIGSYCLIQKKQRWIKAQVVGFKKNSLLLIPMENLDGVIPGASVIAATIGDSIKVDNHLLGEIVDGMGNIISRSIDTHLWSEQALHPDPINPLKRHRIQHPLDVGIRAINGLLTIAQGQRVGLLAGSGVGKSVLLGMMTKHTQADVTVVGLIGERGREVKEFIEDNLGDSGRKRAVIVAAPADTSPLMRLHGALVATSIAEYFRDQGKQVLLLIDSLTRFCQAQREIGLAIGEPPTTRGYPPSVFSKLPQLIERTGPGIGTQGDITAFYTVLAEGDDQQDPIVDAARAILDGHIVLSRELAQMGHYPAIAIEQSVSRTLNQVTQAEHQQHILQFKQAYGLYQQNKELINIGAYQQGTNSTLDHAINTWPNMTQYLQQSATQAVNLQQSIMQLQPSS